ncbi:hypothetical protein GCM10020255_032870 [Rhodococcus baikonurensis]
MSGYFRAAVRAAILRHTLTAILLKLTHLGGQEQSSMLAHNDVFERFHAAVERDFATVRSVSSTPTRSGTPRRPYYGLPDPLPG